MVGDSPLERSVVSPPGYVRHFPSSSLLMMGVATMAAYELLHATADPQFVVRMERRRKWYAARERAWNSRQERIHAALVAAVGERNLSWYEATLHDDCGDY